MAPFDLAKIGIRTVLDDDGGILEQKQTKQQIHLPWRVGTPIIRLEVLDPMEGDRSICDVDQEDNKLVPQHDTPGASSSGALASQPFQRPVKL